MRKVLFAYFFLFALGYLFLDLHNSCYFTSADPEKNPEVLLEWLNSSRACVRSKAAFDLQNVWPLVKEAVPRLVELTKDPDDSVRWRSIAALGYIGVFTDEVKSAIYQAINDSNEITRVNTIFALSRMGYVPVENRDSLKPISDYRQGEKEFRVLLQGLKDPSNKVVYKTLIHLNSKQITDNSKELKAEFEDAILKLTKSSDPQIKGFALASYSKILDPEKIKSITKDYQTQLSDLQNSADPMMKRSAESAVALMEGKNYPILLQMKPEAAEKAEKNCKADSVKNSMDCHLYAELLLYRNQSDEAYKYLEMACPPNSTIASLSCEKLGDRERAKGNRSAAKSFYRRVAEIKGIRMDSPIKLGDMSKEEGDKKEACYWYMLGCAYKNEKACVSASACEGIEDLKKAKAFAAQTDYKIGQENFKAAEEARKNGKNEEARKLLEKSHENNFVLSTLELSRYWRRRGENEKAKSLLASRCNGLNHLPCINLGNIYEEERKFEKAREYYNLACLDNRDSCTDYLENMEARLGNREAAKKYLNLQCNEGWAHSKDRACETLKVLSNPTIAPEQLKVSCEKGSSTDCNSLGEIYKKQIEPDKALRYYKIPCDRENSVSACSGYTRYLLELYRWDEYKKKINELCLKNSVNCLQKATLLERLSDWKGALLEYQKFCLVEKSKLACSKMRRMIDGLYSIEDQKKIYSEYCDTKNDITSCIARGLIFGRESDPDNQKRYLTKAAEIAARLCQSSDAEACAVQGLILCATNDSQKGTVMFKNACKLNSRLCGRESNCANALSYMNESYTQNWN